MAVFLTKPKRVEFPKVAAVRMPHDINKWDDAIIDTLNEQHPYLPVEQIKISISAKDTHKGTAIGAVNVNDKIHIPIVIDQFQLQPFDLFFKNGRLHALSKDSALAALQNLEFGETIPPGQGEVADVFQTHTRAPYDGKYTFAKDMLSDPADVDKALSQVYGTDDVEYFKAVDKSVKKVKDRLTASKKTQVNKGKADNVGTNVLKTNEKLAEFAASGMSAMVVLPEPQTSVPVHSGVVELTAPGKAIRGMLFDKYASMDAMNFVEHALFISESGAGYRVSDVLYGRQLVPAADLASLPLEKIGSDDEPASGDTGVFWWRENDRLVSTEVVKIADRHLKPGSPVVYFVTGSNGLSQRFLTKAAALGRAFFDTRTRMVYLPENARFSKVADYQLAAGSYMPEMTPQPHALLVSSNGLFKVSFVVDSATKDILHGTYKAAELSAMTPSQAARFLGRHFEKESVESALNKLGRTAVLRISIDPFLRRAKMEKAAKVYTEAELAAQKNITKQARVALRAVMQLRDGLDPNQFSRLKDLGRLIGGVPGDILKYAAEFMADQEQDTVDNTLGLNLLSDQNVSKYFDGIDLLEDARQFCLKLLLASRVGMQIDSDAARTAAFALDDVARDLKQLRSMSTANAAM